MHASAILPAGVFRGQPLARRRAGPIHLSSWTTSGPAPVERHQHTEAHFVLVTGGSYATEAEGERDPSGALMTFSPAGVEHEDHLEGGGSFLTITLPPPGALEDGEVSLPQKSVIVRQASALILGYRLLRELSAWGSDSPTVVQGLALELAAALGDWAPCAGAPSWLRRVREQLDDELAAPMELDRIASEAQVHPVHVTRAFRRRFGVTPGEYQRIRRLDRAAHLLAETDWPIVEVALACGFADQAHLTHRFSAAYGISPGAFRRRTRA